MTSEPVITVIPTNDDKWFLYQTSRPLKCNSGAFEKAIQEIRHCADITDVDELGETTLSVRLTHPFRRDGVEESIILPQLICAEKWTGLGVGIYDRKQPGDKSSDRLREVGVVRLTNGVPVYSKLELTEA